MGTKEEDFLRALRETFRLEAEEHLQAIAAALLNLEKTPAPEAQQPMVDLAFRAVHSLKGAARAVDYTEVESACETLEDVFAEWRRQLGAPTRAAFDELHRRIDGIRAAIGHAGRPDSPARQPAPVRGAVPPPAEGEPQRSPTATMVQGSGETVRLPLATLEARLVEAEEMLTAKLTTNQRAAELRELQRQFEAWTREYAVIDAEARLLRRATEASSSGNGATDPAWQGITRVLDFLDWNGEYLKSLERSVASLHRTADHDRQLIGRLVDDLLHNSKELLLLPFGTVAALLPKLVRDLSRDLGKEADLHIRGEEVEVDKRVLDEMKDPLVHLVRNALDHGIEPPYIREQAGKARCGTVTVAASPAEGSSVRIVVADDGAGIDVDRVRASAVARGIISADEARQLTDAEAARLIFEADLSTTGRVTAVSGRGLGLAIVRERVEQFGGSVSIASVRGEGARFELVLPHTLATFRGVLVQVAGRRFVVPTRLVERAVRIHRADIPTVENRETLSLDGRAVALVGLADVLEIPRTDTGQDPDAPRFVLLLGSGDQRIAFAVDSILDEREVLVKPLCPPLSRLRNISGLTVLASGEVAPILDVSDLLKSARRIGGTPRRAPVAPQAPAESKSVLVAEDSITSRMLLKSILEAAGYRVRTAVDGMDAFGLLRSEPFDLLVTDVEMPRLNGFELAARIRADRRLAELPIVLVTTLDTPEDRARGIDIGADAYVVKSHFDQSSLLDAVRRLI